MTMPTDYLHDKGLDRILDDMEALDAPAPDRAAQDDAGDAMSGERWDGLS